MSDRHALANQAMLASITARQTAKFDLHSPICIYKLCEAHGVTVRFNDIGSMEGMYDRGPKPHIHLSALRPLARRAYTCGHELGHHVFGHGSTIDELRDEDTVVPSDNPKEFLADTFSAFALMPTLGLRHAFAVRRWAPETATPQRMFVVACAFGVGYATLITHLAYGLRELSHYRATALLRATPKAIRAEILGEISVSPLIVADEHSNAATIDAEVGTFLLLPAGVAVMNDTLVHERDLARGRLFRANRPGIVRAVHPQTPWAAFVRVARSQYVGLAKYRHLEETPND